MKTQQRFEYTHKGEKKIYLLMPNEYKECINLMENFNKSLDYCANRCGMSTQWMDSGSLKLIQVYLDI